MRQQTSGHESRLNDLLATMSEELNGYTPQTEFQQFARDRQVQRMRKRAKFHRPHLRTEAVDKFVSTNLQVGATRVTLDRQLVRDAQHFILVVLERLNSRFDPGNVQVALDMRYLIEQWRFGPGASNGVKGTHAAEKIYQEMTCTPLCKPLVEYLRRSNHYLAAYDRSQGWSGVVEVRGSRLTTVPKNEDTERTIAIEPSGNMALQLAAGRVLEDALRMLGLDIRDQQSKNKLLALRGSIDGSLATIDLKSASDMILIELVRLLMPREWFLLLMAIRCHEMEVPGHGWVSLNMMSTMGNGFTFPLMTLLLTALIYAYRAQRGGPTLWVDWKVTGVFGDDIIVRSCEFQGVCDMLTAAGLVVNTDKSYSDGPFRESCGGDYYKGHDVTPVYVKSVETDSDVYVVINQLLEWSAKNSKLLHRSITLARSYLRGKVHLVPEWHGPESGVRTSQCPRRYTYLKIQPPRVVLREQHFAMPLACGGYISADGDNMFFSPRPYKTRMRVATARLPRGYLTGEDPLTRPAPTSTYIACYTPLLFA